MQVTFTAQEIIDAYQAVYGGTSNDLYDPTNGIGMGLVDFFVRPDSPVFSYTLASAEVQTTFGGYVGTAEGTSPLGSGEITTITSRWARWIDRLAAPIYYLTSYDQGAEGPLTDVNVPPATFGFVPTSAVFRIQFNNVSVTAGNVGSFRWYVFGTTFESDGTDWFVDSANKDMAMSFTMDAMYYTATPEPGSMLLLAGGLGVLAAARRFRRR